MKGDGSSLSKRVANAFAWEGATKLAVQAVSWISTIFVARALVPEDYGLVAISGLFTSVLALVSEFGLGAGIVTRREVTDDEYNRCFWLGLLGSLVLYLLLFMAAPLIASLYGIPVLKSIVRVAAIGLLISAIKIVPYSQVLRSLNYRFRALVEMVGQFIQAGSTISFALHGFGAWSLIFGYLIAQSTMSLIFLSQVKALSWPNISLRGLDGLVGFGVRITGARLLGFFVQSCDMIFITSLLGARQAGLYSVSANFATSPLDKIGAIFNRVAFPIVARLQDDPTQARQLFIRLHFYLLAVASPALVGLALVSKEAVATVLSAKWEGAAHVLGLLCMANVVRLSGMVMPTILEGLGQAGKVLRYQAMCAIVLPIGFIIGSRWGLTGITMTWLIAYPVVYAWLVRVTLGVLGIPQRDLFSAVVPVLMSNGVMAASVIATRTVLKDLEAWERLIVLVMIGALSYSVSMLLLLPKATWRELRGGLRSLKA